MTGIKNSKIIKRFKCGYNVHEAILDTNEGPVKIKRAYTPNGEYIGTVKEANILCNKLGIKPQKINKNYNICNIGFSEKNQKWYAWSYWSFKGIFEFGIGSKITKDSKGYKANSPQGLYDQYTDIDKFAHYDLKDIKITKTGVRLTTYAANSKPTYHYVACGRGEWEAKTLADAKLMAIATAKYIL